MLNNKNILITGGTGTFGKNFTAHILKNYKPKKLIIFSRDEYKQFKMKKIFSEEKYKNIRYFLGDIRDRERTFNVLQNVDIVIHSAALKHVQSSEYNPSETVKTNIIGTMNVIDSCIANKVKKVIALSTDKASSPNNLYGATKLVSEKLFLNANDFSAKKVKFSIVRYGNVLSSRGSVLPLFKNCLVEKKPFPITSQEMTRFWITINQGVNLVDMCIKIMRGDEIFIPKMPSLKLTDLAKSLSLKNKMKIIGLFPGEKIHEELISFNESAMAFDFKKFFIISKNVNKNRLKYGNLIGKKVDKNFIYQSNKNIFLSIDQIKKKINEKDPL